MSKRLDVVNGAKALVVAALPFADVLGLVPEAAKAGRIGPGGRAIVRQGDPGDPQMDLSPPRYNYEHRIPVDLDAATVDTLDAMLVAIGEAVEASRTLGGLVDYLDAEMPEVEDYAADGVAGTNSASLTLVASYATSNPLT